MSLRKCPRTSHEVDHSSATSNSRSPDFACICFNSAARSVSLKNLATGESKARSSPTLIQTKPFAPICFARSVKASNLLRPDAAASGYVAASTRRPLIDFAVANALNSVAANTSVSSMSSIPKRKSGLSLPKRFIASCHVICSIGGGV